MQTQLNTYCALLMNDMHVSQGSIHEFEKNWQEALRLCLIHGIKEVFIGGDLWQSRSAQTLETLMAVYKFVRTFGDHCIHLVIAEGNHCKVNQEALEGYSQLFAPYPMVTVVEEYQSFQLSEQLVISVMSYFPENNGFIPRFKRLSQEVSKQCPSFYNLLYIHEGINGGLNQLSDDELPITLFDSSCFQKVLVGHYHNRKKINGSCVEYIGASRQHNFGEDERKGYVLVRPDGSFDYYDNQVNTRYVVLEKELGQINQKDFLQLIESYKLHSNYDYRIKVKIKSDSLEITPKQREKLIEAGVSKIEVLYNGTCDTATPSQTFDNKFNKDQLKDEYVCFCSDKGESSQLGIQYLNKINYSCGN